MTVPKTKVVNIHYSEPYEVYIGRGSLFGNPFTHQKDTQAEYLVDTREEAIAAYREWVQTQPHILAEIPKLKGKRLGCYCYPLACHGEILAELADNTKQSE